MSRQTLKDQNSRVIGYIDTHASGMQVAKDLDLHILGFYDPNAGVTRDINYKVVASTNILASLITRADHGVPPMAAVKRAPQR